VRQLRTVPVAVRVLLSGTPIQNNLMEMHSLFDFACEVRHFLFCRPAYGLSPIWLLTTSRHSLLFPARPVSRTMRQANDSMCRAVLQAQHDGTAGERRGDRNQLQKCRM